MRGRELALRLGLCVLAVVLVATGGVALSYSEVTDQVGIDFQLAGEVHPSDHDWPTFPAIMGSGACIADVDGDGYDDVYIVNQRYNPNNPASEDWWDRFDMTNELYLNDGDGTFTEFTEVAGVGHRGWGYGCSLADYDADGDVDLFVSNLGQNALFENTGNGTFENVTASSGIDMAGACGEHRCMSTSSAWADYDGDGDLDLYVGNYVDSNLTDQIRGPRNHDGQINFLFENQGDGTFVEVADEAGVQGNPTDTEGSKTLGVVWFDAEQDGDPDLYVANDLVPNDFYVNQGDGTFVEKSLESNLDDDRASMGVTAQDYDADGYDDLFFTHYETETNGFYRNLGDGTFEDRSGEDGQTGGIPHVSWGTLFFDADRDGDLDIVVASGHTEWGGPHYTEPYTAYRQDPDPASPAGDVEWVDVSQDWGLLDVREGVTRGMAFGDLDLDGDTDAISVNNANDTAQVLEASGVDNHHLTVRVTQPGENPDAIGARIGVTVDGETMYQTLRAGASYLSQNSLALGFGLGDATVADEVTVEWPDGGVTSFTDVAADQVIRIDRATGAYVNDTIAPITELDIAGEPGEHGWYVSPVEVTTGATDRGTTHVSGVSTVEMALDDGAWGPGDEALELGAGVHHVHHRATDEASNQGPKRTTLVKVDLDDPSASHSLDGTLGEAGWYVSDTVNVSLSGEDATSGVDHLEHRVDGGAWEVHEEDIVLDDNGVHEVEYRAVDRAGNVGPVESVTVKLDDQAPNITMTSPREGEIYVANTQVASGLPGPAVIVVPPEPTPGLAASFPIEADVEDDVSGVGEARWLLNGETQDEARSQAPFAWTWEINEAPSGAYEVRLEAEDAAGNTAEQWVQVVATVATQAGLDATVEQGPSTYQPAPALPTHLSFDPRVPLP